MAAEIAEQPAVLAGLLAAPRRCGLSKVIRT
jgi:hypothetical protein